jgi:hypothetical protein
LVRVRAVGGDRPLHHLDHLQSAARVGVPVRSASRTTPVLYLHGLAEAALAAAVDSLWRRIPEPTVVGRLLVALDDSINNKTGRRVFGCGFFHDHTAKRNQPEYPWAQNIVSIGLLKPILGRWACLPLAFRFYLLLKDVGAQAVTTLRRGQSVGFRTKLEQAVEMLVEVANAFVGTPLLVVTDSWFGNAGLWKPLKRQIGSVDLLSRLRANLTLFERPPARHPGQKGRPRKYGVKLGSVAQMAASLRDQAEIRSVPLYGRRRQVSLVERVLMVNTLQCPVRVVWVFRANRFVAFFTTDLSLTPEQMLEYYGARWKIESGYKEIKQDLGSRHCQARTADAVTNHLHFCMMAATLVWIYAARTDQAPLRRHAVSGRSGYAFSDVRRTLAEIALSDDFRRLCPLPRSSPKNAFVALLLRLVA